MPTLYAHPFSSYCMKAAIGLDEAGLAWEEALLDASEPHNEAAFRRLWPIGKFPLLVADDGVWMEATIIVEWADRATGGGRLIPDDPAAALRVRMFDRLFDNYVMGPMQRIVADALRPPAARRAGDVGEARAALDTSYAWLDGALRGDAWAVGEGFTLADCAAAPSLLYADWVHPIPARLPVLRGYRARLLARPSVARAVDRARPWRGYFPPGDPGRD